MDAAVETVDIMDVVEEIVDTMDAAVETAHNPFHY